MMDLLQIRKMSTVTLSEILFGIDECLSKGNFQVLKNKISIKSLSSQKSTLVYIFTGLQENHIPIVPILLKAMVYLRVLKNSYQVIFL